MLSFTRSRREYRVVHVYGCKKIYLHIKLSIWKASKPRSMEAILVSCLRCLRKMQRPGHPQYYGRLHIAMRRLQRLLGQREAKDRILGTTIGGLE